MEEGSQQNARTQTPIEISGGDSGWLLIALQRGLECELYNLTLEQPSGEAQQLGSFW